MVNFKFNKQPNEVKMVITMMLVFTLLSCISALLAYSAYERAEELTRVYRAELQTTKQELKAARKDVFELNNTNYKLMNQLAAAESHMPEGTETVPYKPSIALTFRQEAMCLAIGIYGETRGSDALAKEWVGWSIVARMEDPRDTWIYRPSSCGVLAAGKGGQYSSMGPYLSILEKVVWGGAKDYQPSVTKENALELAAWKESVQIASDILAGKLTRKTRATHFVAPRGLKGHKFPSWLAAFKPVGAAGHHIFFIDWEVDKNGKRRIFTKHNPYMG